MNRWEEEKVEEIEEALEWVVCVVFPMGVRALPLPLPTPLFPLGQRWVGGWVVAWATQDKTDRQAGRQAGRQGVRRGRHPMRCAVAPVGCMM